MRRWHGEFNGRPARAIRLETPQDARDGRDRVRVIFAWPCSQMHRRMLIVKWYESFGRGLTVSSFPGGDQGGSSQESRGTVATISIKTWKM